MNTNNKNGLVVIVAAVVALGVGVAIGMTIKKSAKPATASGISYEGKSVEELSTRLSELMLPEEEFVKLEEAIFQTGMGLFMAQAQSAGVTVAEASQQELKKSIQEKYSRKYFADINSASMKDLGQADLVLILNFYDTEAGKKFLALSPKIIQQTMKVVQQDLSAWLPKTVEAMVAKLKGGEVPAEKADDKPAADAVPKELDKPAADAKPVEEEKKADH